MLVHLRTCSAPAQCWVLRKALCGAGSRRRGERAACAGTWSRCGWHLLLCARHTRIVFVESHGTGCAGS